MNDLRTAAQQALEVEADRRRKALAAEMRAALAQQAEPPGCDHCNHPLYAATRCRVCGRVTEQAEAVEGPETVDQRVGSLVESALQAVAEKIGDQCAVWYGIGARDVEEVLREAARYGLVHGTLAEPVSADAAYQRWLADTHAPALRRMDSQGAFAAGWQAALAQQAEPPGCDHCNHPLYAATRCRVCGRVTA